MKQKEILKWKGNLQYYAEMGKKCFVKTRNAVWVKLGQQLTLPVYKGARILRRRTNGTEFITGRAPQPSNDLYIA